VYLAASKTLTVATHFPVLLVNAPTRVIKLIAHQLLNAAYPTTVQYVPVRKAFRVTPRLNVDVPSVLEMMTASLASSAVAALALTLALSQGLAEPMPNVIH
jgi:hypothetical protein